VIETTYPVSAKPLFDPAFKIIDLENGEVGRMCMSGIVYSLSDGSAQIVLEANYPGFHDLVDDGAITKDPQTGDVSFVTKDNARYTIRDPRPEDEEWLAEEGYNLDGTEKIEEGTSDGAE
jgi:hypothetical protein